MFTYITHTYYRGCCIVIKKQEIGEWYACIDEDEGIGFPVADSPVKALRVAKSLIDYQIDGVEE